jgi:hypothetical protein
MNIIARLIARFTDSGMDEYWQRFIEPEITRARQLGLSEDTISALLKWAINESDGYLRFPAALFRDMIDMEDTQHDR